MVSNYYVHRSSESYLEHAATSGGTGAKKSHKYIFKINVGGKTRYFYNPLELEAFRRAKTRVSNTVGGAIANIRRTAGRGKNVIGSVIKKADKALGISSYRQLKRLTNKRDERKAYHRINQTFADMYGREIDPKLQKKYERTLKRYNTWIGNIRTSDYNDSLIGKAERAINSFKYGKESQSQKKAFKQLQETAKKDREARRGYTGVSVNGKRLRNDGSYNSLTEQEELLREKRARERRLNEHVEYDKPRRSRNRRGGVKKK